MKLNFKKTFNPLNINFEVMKKMTPEQQVEYLKELHKSEFARMYVQWTYTLNYLCMTNTWQYIVALWVM